MEEEGLSVSEYSRRNRGNKSDGYDDFDWEKFDRRTRSESTVSSTDSEPLRRRRQTTPEKPVRKRTSSRTQEREPLETPVRRTSSTSGTSTRKVATTAPSVAPVTRKKKRKKQLSKEQVERRRKIRKILIATILIVVVVLSGVFVGMYAAVSREIKEMNLSGLALNYSSTLYYYDKRGNEVEIGPLHSDKNSIPVESGEISPAFKDAIVSIEDERFYTHPGVDLKRTVGATVKYVFSKIGIGESSYGGSTITQQVIKNITLEDDFKATRKVKEIMRALALENELSKDEILTLYCNVAYFGNGCNGVEAASRLYFNKSAIDLNIQEAASIAGITQYPSMYDPILNPENNVEKRNIVLKKMYELGKITKDEYDVAVASPLELDKGTIRNQGGRTSYFEDMLVNDLIRDLMERKNYTEEFATSQVFNGGLKIYATIDPNVQSAMENVFENQKLSNCQAAMVVIDPHTGQVKGVIGGLGPKTDIRGFNRADQAVRQPGSAIKPLAVYAPAVDLGKITAADVIKDEAITIGNDNWKPKNAYSGFKGYMTVKEAVARSSNIPAVKVLDEVGLSNSYGYLKNKFQLSTIVDGDKNYSSLALGGLTKGVTVREMAAAYGVFVNSGKYIAPYTYTKVTNPKGEVVLENYANETQAISETAAYIMADILSGPTTMSMGTATGAYVRSGMPTYGKTGTTDDDFDKWFVGFTPYYVGAVWYGFDNPSSLKAAGISSNPGVSSWKKVFDEISEDLPNKTLQKPSSVKEAYFCPISGNIPSETCGSVKGYFVPGTQPKQPCTNHYGEELPTEEPEETEDPNATEDPDATENPNATPKPTTGPAATPTPSGTGEGTGTETVTPPDSGSNEPSGEIITE